MPGRMTTMTPATIALLLSALLAHPAAAQGMAEELPEIVEPIPLAGPAVLLAHQVLATRDNAGLPFVVVDKPAARIFVFDADGRLLGADTVLLGLARGDDSVPGIGDRPLAAIRPEERTTPAGRFLAGFGPAAGGKDVLWVDFDTAVSLHAVITSNPREQRLKRLATEATDDNRITYGCINVTEAFYEDVVRPTFMGGKGVVYILPEEKSAEEVFSPALAGALIKSAALSAPAD